MAWSTIWNDHENAPINTLFYEVYEAMRERYRTSIGATQPRAIVENEPITIELIDLYITNREFIFDDFDGALNFLDYEATFDDVSDPPFMDYARILELAGLESIISISENDAYRADYWLQEKKLWDVMRWFYIQSPGLYIDSVTRQIRTSGIQSTWALAESAWSSDSWSNNGTTYENLLFKAYGPGVFLKETNKFLNAVFAFGQFADCDNEFNVDMEFYGSFGPADFNVGKYDAVGNYHLLESISTTTDPDGVTFPVLEWGDSELSQSISEPADTDESEIEIGDASSYVLCKMDVNGGYNYIN